jgi:hypothetical protein
MKHPKQNKRARQTHPTALAVPSYHRILVKHGLIAPILKDQSFKEEREWRVISRPMFAKGLDYREGRSLVVPYYNLPLCEDGQRLHLHEIVIGPTKDAERSKSSVTSLIVSRKVVMQGIAGVNIRISQVPYRDW